MNVLVIEDDQKISELLQRDFEEAGICARTSNGINVFELAASQQFDLFVVDVMLPVKDGFTIVEELRQRGIDIPVIFLTAKRSISDRVEGFRSGGDDYMTKPFSFAELQARCQAIFRRTSKQIEARKLKYCDLEMDLNARVVTRNFQPIELPQKEFALLEYFLKNQERVLTKTQILEAIWKYDFDPQTNVVDVLVCRLRNKIDSSSSIKLVKTIRGVGYVLRSE